MRVIYPECASEPECSPIQEPTLFGISFSPLSESGFFALLESGIAAGGLGYIVTPNLDFARLASSDADFKEALDGAVVRLCDSAILYYLLKIRRSPVPAKLSGSDLTPMILDFAEERGFSVYLLGSDGATLRAVEKRYPKAVVGWDSPPFRSRLWEEDELNARYVEKIKALGPDLVLLALGAPKQEFWAKKYHLETGVPVTLCIGASLDFIGKKAVRSPRLLSILGMEWVWRLAQEPRRLWKRYFLDAVFLLRNLSKC